MSTEAADKHALNEGRTFTWHELYVASSKAAIDFYTSALGFGSEAMPMGQAGTYNMLTMNGQSVAGLMGTDEMPDMKDVPPHWAVYLAVDDVDARLEKCIAMGAKKLVGPMDVPTVGRMVLIQDPFGAHLWLFKSANM